MSNEIPKVLTELAQGLDGKIDEVGRLPDGSGFATISWPLRPDHWIYGKDDKKVPGYDFTYNAPPMPFRMGFNDPRRNEWAEKIRAAGRYAVRSATMDGKESDFDPDALVQNLVVGMLGYWTEDGLSADPWANPYLVPPIAP